MSHESPEIPGSREPVSDADAIVELRKAYGNMNGEEFPKERLADIIKSNGLSPETTTELGLARFVLLSQPPKRPFDR